MSPFPPFLLLMLALLPFAGAVLLSSMAPQWRRACAWAAGAVALAGLGIVLAAAPDVFAGQVPRWRVDWMPALGLAFGFRMDGLAWLFALLITGIGALIVLYAAYYLHHGDPARRFFVFLLLFMGAMLGIVLADNLILLVVYWELTSLSSFLLIGYWSHRQDARAGARMALAVTGAGGLALLAGVLLIGSIVGSTDLDQVLASGDVIRDSSLYPLVLVLILLGCFTKSAQFPFHFWLPHAMAAPTPVSAYLHSATMVKAGVFLLARLYPALGESELWFWIVSCTGLATLLVGAYIAIFQHDLKGLLAYSTISHLGLITLLFGLDEPLAVVAGVFHIINHATFKASLFMAAGIIDHETGSRDMRQLNGLWKHMPWTGLLATIATAAMAGVPLANGFLSKEMFFAEAVAKEGYEAMMIALPLLATLGGILSVAYSARFIHDVFFNGEPVGLAKTPHEPPLFMRVPVEVLVVLCLAVGLLPGLVIGPTLAVAGQAALYGGPLGALPEYTLAIWHGLNLPLAMSVVALSGGAMAYFALQKFVNLHTVARMPLPVPGGRAVFDWLLARLLRLAGAVTGTLQNGSLQRYLTWLFIVVLAAGALPFLRGVPLQTEWIEQTLPPLPLLGIAVVGMVAAFAAVVAYRNRLLAIVLVGAVGLVVSLVFVFFSAPDLALTQLLVEVVSITLMMLALNWLPHAAPAEGAPLARNARKLRDLALAVLAGLGTTALMLLVLMRPFDSISPYYLKTTVDKGGGANAVNVIIVDYRGFDTLGEVTVLGMAGIIIFALLAHFVPKPGLAQSSALADPQASEEVRHPLLLQLVSRLILPLAAVVSIYLFLRGHNQPGGGFIAGLVLAIALILLFVANGGRWVEDRLWTDFRGWIGFGLIVAALTGVGSWFLGSPFLTSTYDYPNIWPFGPVPLASAALFDLGVYLTVVGGTVSALIAIGRINRREANLAERRGRRGAR
ncbi:MAG: monovalent cation/H+ antiporter subunit A [Betaproteobacteria bacterium]|jgi:multicomponent K+:H+ antiporter subunit A